jgi:acyl-coenzyme A synthetase/AMP-(fatty) acid ligase
MLQSRDICVKYNLDSVRFVYSGAAPLGEETIRELQGRYPKWTIAQAYGEFGSPSQEVRRKTLILAGQKV